ncbi:MAG: PHP domain-containing protein [Patescibacteria group bacterium]
MIDLHLHTRASDGTWTPGRAAAEAAKAGMTAIAFTDHDSLASVAAGRRAAKKLGLRFINAVEITAGSNAEDVLHILGYGVDKEHVTLRGILARNQAAWRQNELLSIEALAGLGIRIDPERYAYWERHREAGGWPTYNCLVEMGLVADYRDYFGKYFGPGRPAHVTTEFVQPQEAVAAIAAAGGVPVLAHPGAYDPRGRSILERPGFLDAMVAMGIAGFEAIANENSPEVTEHLLAYCRRRDLLATGGSDCHGEFAGRRLGRPPVPDSYLPPLLARLRPGSYV